MKQLHKENIRDILALSPMQSGILYHYLENPGSRYYFVQLNLELEGEICLQRFERAWDFVVDTNEMLRTVFRWEKLETPAQLILGKHTLDWRFEDLTSIGDSREQTKQWETIKQQDRSRQFDLREVPFRVILGKMAQSRYHLLISNHHILYDGWSTGIILKEFFQAYETLARQGSRNLSNGIANKTGRSKRNSGKITWRDLKLLLDCPSNNRNKVRFPRGKEITDCI